MLKILVWDIETSPMITYTFQLHDQNIRLEQVIEDWTILAWSAKWLGAPESEIVYMDTRNQENIRDDKKITRELVKMLNQADVVITHNGNSFDIKKVNSRAALNRNRLSQPYKSIDTYRESKKVFSFTSHSLEYLSEKLNLKHKKLKHKKFPGLSLWKAVLVNNVEAWEEMKKYCINDVLATEELFGILAPWIDRGTVNLTKTEKRGFFAEVYQWLKKSF